MEHPMTSPNTNQQDTQLVPDHIAGLERVAHHARLLLDRLKAVEQSGVLSETARDALAEWAQRLATSLSLVPHKAPNLVKSESSEAPAQESES